MNNKSKLYRVFIQVKCFLNSHDLEKKPVKILERMTETSYFPFPQTNYYTVELRACKHCRKEVIKVEEGIVLK